MNFKQNFDSFGNRERRDLNLLSRVFIEYCDFVLSAQNWNL
jgi:hypothetical protein